MRDRSTSADPVVAVLDGRRQARRLALFRGVLADDIGGAFLDLLDVIAEGHQTGQLDADHLGFRYARLFALLAAEAELRPHPLVGDAWQNHLLDRLLVDENPFSLKAQMADPQEAGEALMDMVRSELRVLQSLFDLGASTVCGAIQLLMRSLDGKNASDWLISWATLRPLNRTNAVPPSGVASDLARADDWGEKAERLAAHYAASGAGIFARHVAFRWGRHAGGGELAGVEHPDPIRLEELLAYDKERHLLIQNTEQFLAGYPANNVLLYGDRGTGKSSTVKALLNRYARQGLRLIEVPRHLLSDFTEILAHLRGRRERFILFVDDLSFDDHETDYKGLKAILEGGLEAKPDNVLLYATSNRRHLVQERFSDRQAAANDEEIHLQDTSQEKLSLSDRFGITIVFLAPDQERFLRIVAGLAKQRALPIDDDALRARALAWAARQNGRSGRSARQFIDHLTGELGMRHS